MLGQIIFAQMQARDVVMAASLWQTLQMEDCRADRLGALPHQDNLLPVEAATAGRGSGQKSVSCKLRLSITFDHTSVGTTRIVNCSDPEPQSREHWM